jgi:hypothetical protein
MVDRMPIRTLSSLSVLALLLFAPGCRKQAPTAQVPQQQQISQQEIPKPAIVQSAPNAQESLNDGQKGDFVMSFTGPKLVPKRKDPNVNYALNPAVEQFYLHVPEDYSGEKAYGLVVFVDADSDSRQVPAGWQTVLDSREYLYIAPQNAGNDQYTNRRLVLRLGCAQRVRTNQQGAKAPFC